MVFEVRAGWPFPAKSVQSGWKYLGNVSSFISKCWGMMSLWDFYRTLCSDKQCGVGSCHWRIPSLGRSQQSSLFILKLCLKSNQGWDRKSLGVVKCQGERPIQINVCYGPYFGLVSLLLVQYKLKKKKGSFLENKLFSTKHHLSPISVFILTLCGIIQMAKVI